MAARTRAIALLLSAGCVLAWSLPSPAQTPTSPPCSRSREDKWWKATEAKNGAIPTKIESVTLEGDIHMPVPEQEEVVSSIQKLNESSDPGLEQLRNVVGAYARMKWQNYGYFKVKVTKVEASLLASSPTQQTAAVTIYVEDGPLFRLGEITFQHETVFSPEQLRPLFPFQAGDVFDVEKVRTGLDELRKLYGTQGYINFTAVPDTQIDEANHRVSLVIDEDEGKQFRVESTGIVGLDQSRADALMARWPFQSGDVYNSSLVEPFFKENASLLPAGADPENNLALDFSQRRGTVAVTLDFRPCP